MMGESKEGSATGLWYKWQADGSLIEKTDFTAIPQETPTLATEEKPQEDPIESPVETSQAPLDELFTAVKNNLEPHRERRSIPASHSRGPPQRFHAC